MSDFGDWGWQGPNKRGFDFPQGSAVPSSPDGRLRLRYNEVTASLQQSIGGGPYVDIGGAVPVGPDIVNVFSVGDLPTPAAGVITLDPTKVYRFQDVIDLGTDRIDLNGSSMRGLDPQATGITTDNASAAVFSTNGGLISQCLLENPIGSAIDLAGPRVVIAGCAIENCLSVGRIGNCTVGFQLFRVFFRDVDDGIDIDGTSGSGGVLLCTFIPSVGAGSFIGIDFTASCSLGLFRSLGNNFITANAADRAYRMDAAASLGLAQPGVFDFNGLQGPGAAFSGAFDQTDVRWFFEQNLNIDDSSFGGEISFFGGGGGINTIISTTGVYVPIGTGTASPPHPSYSLNPDSERFSIQGTYPNQVLRYDGLATQRMMVSYDATYRRGTGGGTPEYSFQLTQNGSPLVDSRRNLPAANVTVFVAGFTFVTASPGDEFQLQVTNNTALQACQVNEASLAAMRLS